MTFPTLKEIIQMEDVGLLRLINDMQRAFEGSPDAGADDILAMIRTTRRAYRELRNRGMTDLEIETGLRGLPGSPRY